VGDSALILREDTPDEADSVSCPGPFFAVQVGSFRELDNAERMRGKMSELYGVARLVEVNSGEETLYRVVVGQAADGAAAQRLRERLSRDRFDGYVTRVDPAAAAQCL
jgi:cell division protein FtsN